MKVIEAKEQVLKLIYQDMKTLSSQWKIISDSPDDDAGKISLAGQPARVIHPRDGFYAKINLSWFSGANEMPKIKKGDFYWYIFALTKNLRKGIDSYFICDYTQMRSWVLEFSASVSNTHQDHSYWRGEIHVLDAGGKKGYFRWGDEAFDQNRESRFINLRNIEDIIDPVTNLYVIEEKAEYNVDRLPTSGNPLDEIRRNQKSYISLSATERETVIQSRLGQGQFRQKLIDFWQGCSVTQYKNIPLLRASHIKPWWVSNNQERLDMFNGLLLIPNLDIVFDKGLITFDDDGVLQISSQLDETACTILGVKPEMKLVKVELGHKPYFQYHREKIFKP